MENQYLSRIEEALASYLPAKDCLQKDVIEAMEYSLLAGGKRIRPTLTNFAGYAAETCRRLCRLPALWK